MKPIPVGLLLLMENEVAALILTAQDNRERAMRSVTLKLPLVLGVLVLVLSPMLCAWAQPQPPVWGSLEPGPYAIGFQVVGIHDVTRAEGAYPEAEGRPVQLSIWYPAQPAASPMRFATYAHVLTKQTNLDALTMEQKRQAERSLLVEMSRDRFYLLDATKIETLLQMPTRAFYEATPVEDHFPLLLWGLRHTSAAGQSVMNEYLASHGYVVVVPQYTGLRPRYPWEAQPVLEITRTIDGWTQDLATALAFSRALPYVNPEHIGTLAWSYGGVSAILLQMRYPEIDAFVGLDSALDWTLAHLAQAPYYDATRLTIPTMIMEKYRENSVTLYDSLRYAEGYLLTFHTLEHGNFNALEGMIPAVLGMEEGVASWSKPGPDAIRGYETMARYTRRFFDAYLKEDPAGRAYLDQSPEAHGLRPAFLTATSKRAVDAPLQEAHLLSLLAADEVATLQTRHDDQLDEARLADLASRLLDDVRFEEALRVLHLNTTLRPESAMAHYYLGDAYLRMGETERALEHYRACLSRTPDCNDAARLLEQLGAR